MKTRFTLRWAVQFHPVTGQLLAENCTDTVEPVPQRVLSTINSRHQSRVWRSVDGEPRRFYFGGVIS